MNDGVKRRVVAAYKALHEHGVLHSDVRRENVLVLRDGSVRIIDFDNASILPEEDIKLTLREDDEVELMLNGMTGACGGPTQNGRAS
jgi:serine/threonine protein kinase